MCNVPTLPSPPTKNKMFKEPALPGQRISTALGVFARQGHGVLWEYEEKMLYQT